MSSPSSPPAKIARHRAIGYASAETGVNAVETAVRLFLLKHATDVVGLQPWVAGVLVALGVLWDAVSDPVMGYLSDRTMARRGSRAIFLMPGAWLTAVAFYALWSIRGDQDPSLAFWSLLAAYLGVNTGLTVLSVPLIAMASDLSRDRDERSLLMGLRFAFMNVGALVAIALPTWLPPISGGETLRFGTAAASAVGLTLIATAGWSWHSVRSARATPASALRREGLLESARQAFREPAFAPLLGAFVVATIGIAMNGSFALFYYESRLQLSAAQIETILLVFMVIFTLSIAFWVQMAKRFGKRRPMVLAVTVLGLGTSLLYPNLDAGAYTPALWIGAVGLGSMVGAIALLDSMLTDVIDLDRLRGGAGRAGTYFGVWRFGSKVARAAALLASGVALDLIGYQEGSIVQTDAVRAKLGWLFGPAVGLVFFGAGLLLARYRFDDRQQRRVQRLLARRDALRAAREEWSGLRHSFPAAGARLEVGNPPARKT